MRRERARFAGEMCGTQRAEFCARKKKGGPCPVPGKSPLKKKGDQKSCHVLLEGEPRHGGKRCGPSDAFGRARGANTLSNKGEGDWGGKERSVFGRAGKGGKSPWTKKVSECSIGW